MNAKVHTLRLLPLLVLLFGCEEQTRAPAMTGFPLEQEGFLINQTVSVSYEALSWDRDLHLTRRVKPVRFAVFEVLDSQDEPLAVGVTDQDGVARAEFLALPDSRIRLRVLTLSGLRDVPYQVGTFEDEVYSYVGPHLRAGQQEAWYLIPSEDIGGAFHIFDVQTAALEQLSRFIGPCDKLRVRWEPGLARSCGSCFSPHNSVMEVGGGDADPDHWDDSVLLHELGHYFETAYAHSDNMGGLHQGERVWPTMAWSEGFASAFGQSWLGSSLYMDRGQGSVMVMDLESMGYEAAYGTENGALAGKVSELLVSAVLWDLMDSGRENGDSIQEPALVLFGVAASWLKELPLDLGATGVDLADFIGGLLHSETGAPQGLAAILAMRRFPFPFRELGWMSGDL